MTDEEKQQLFFKFIKENGGNIGQINFGDGYQQINNYYASDNVGEIVPEQEAEEEPAHMPILYNSEKWLKIYEFLAKNEFISKETRREDFFYWMGISSERPADIKPIVWKKNKQLLREFLETMYKSLIDDKQLRKVDIENLVPQIFVDSDGKNMVLAKNKHEDSWESDKINELFKEISD